MPTREIYWNVQGIWAMYALFILAIALFAYGVYRHYRLITLGKQELRFDRPWERLAGVASQAFGQMRGLRDRYSGLMHFLFFWAFIFLFVGTVVVFLQADLGIHVMQGAFYLYFQSLTLDAVGLLGMLGLSMALLKRYLFRPDRLLNPSRHRSLLDDGIILGLILSILITGFVLEGLRIAATADPWAAWSPVGAAISAGLTAAGVGRPALIATHGFLWWIHLFLAFAFIAYIP